jgi:dUTP pyrophosphatase
MGLKMFFKGLKPYRGTEQSAGLDLFAKRSYEFKKNQMILVDTGTSVVIPDGHFGLLTVRSSLGVQGMCLVNGVGIIDSDYRGEVMVAIRNISGKKVYISANQRIAQIVVVPYSKVDLQELAFFGDDVSGTDRVGGFGSTGAY